MQAYGGDVAMITVTAPGASVLPWTADREAVEPVAAREWNRSAPANWRSLHRAASMRARRRHGKLTLVAWTWEYQRRGVLHKHAILGMATPRERAAAHTYLLALDELRHRHGFGFVSDTRRSGSWRRRGLEVIPAQRASRYAAKYIAKRSDVGDLVLSETVTRRDVPPLVVYVSRSMTARTGVTMRMLRARRWAFVLAPRIGLDHGRVLQLLMAGVDVAGSCPLRGP